jgi:hypothetical protein
MQFLIRIPSSSSVSILSRVCEIFFNRKFLQLFTNRGQLFFELFNP